MMLTTHVPLAPMFRTSRALPFLTMYFMGFEFIFAEKAQQVRLENQLLWIASQENRTYRLMDAVTFPFKTTNRYDTAVTLGVVSCTVMY